MSLSTNACSSGPGRARRTRRRPPGATPRRRRGERGRARATARNQCAASGLAREDDAMDDLLARLERYYDEAPRANADTEEHGPFTIFVSRGGWPYYARPRLGCTDEITPDEVTSVLARLEELGLPRSIEWVHDTTPYAPRRRDRAPGSRSATTRCSSSPATRSSGRARSPYAGSRPTTPTSPRSRPRSTSGSARTTPSRPGLGRRARRPGEPSRTPTSTPCRP